MGRYGITVPFDGIPLSEQGGLFAELADLGFDPHVGVVRGEMNVGEHSVVLSLRATE